MGRVGGRRSFAASQSSSANCQEVSQVSGGDELNLNFLSPYFTKIATYAVW